MDRSEQVSYGHQSEGFDYSELIWEVRQQSQQVNQHVFHEQNASVPPIYNDRIFNDVSQAIDNSTVPQVANQAQHSAAEIIVVMKRQNRLRKKAKKPKESKKDNKTKNFLQFLKTHHRNYLERYCKEHNIRNIRDHDILKPIFFTYKQKKSKQGQERNDGQKGIGEPKLYLDPNMALQDFETIYKIEELSQCWTSMFQSCYLYRQMMIGRVKFEQKFEYNRRMQIVQEAFKTKSFERIR